MIPKFLNKKLSTRIGIAIILFCAGLVGILAWQYFWVPEEVKVPEKEVKAPEEKVPEEVTVDEQELAKSMIIEFMDARMDRDVNRAKSYLTNNGEQAYSHPYFIDYALVGISNPHYSRFEILKIEKLDLNKFKFIVRIYEYLVETKEKGDFQYFDEELTVIKINNNYLVDSVKRGEFVIIQDETANWKTYRNEEYGFEVKYPLEWKDYLLSEENKILWRIPDKTIDFFHTISIEVYKRDYISAEDWLKELNTSVPEEAYPPNYEINREVTIGGVSGIEVSQESEGGLYTKVGIIKNNFIYEFTKVKANWERNEKIDKEFYQILSTFRFIE